MPDLMTGKFALKLIEGLAAAVEAAGQGEMRGIKALMKLNAMGLDVVPIEAPAVGVDRLGGE